jgi:uncharacterized protein YjgD (DUF1641 family)
MPLTSAEKQERYRIRYKAMKSLLSKVFDLFSELEEEGALDKNRSKDFIDSLPDEEQEVIDFV